MNSEMKQVQTKTVGEAKQILKRLTGKCIKDGHDPMPVFLWGGPGIGKSAIVRQLVEELDMDPEKSFIDQRLQQIDPVDLRGLPYPNEEGRLEYNPPTFLPDHGKGILFLDELNLAPKQVQAAAYELVLDRKLGDSYHLPDGWMVIAAGNRTGDKAFVNPMAAPLANRFIHWEVGPTLEDWKEWAYEENIESDIIGYLNFKPRMLYQFDPERSEHAFPTPRTWERVSDLMKMGFHDEEEIAGAIGQGAAAEFKSFVELREKLPDIDKIFEGDFEVPDEPDLLYATISSLVEKAREKPELGNRLVEYANRMPEDRAEFSIVLVKDAIRAGIPVQETEEFKEFVEGRKEFIL